MFEKDLNNLLLFLTSTLNKYDFADDNQKVQYFYEEIKKIKKKFPTIEKINELQDIELDLEVKYEIFYELDNYFHPIYTEIKNIIHKEKVNKLREENRRKRGLS